MKNAEHQSALNDVLCKKGCTGATMGKQGERHEARHGNREKCCGAAIPAGRVSTCCSASCGWHASEVSQAKGPTGLLA